MFDKDVITEKEIVDLVNKQLENSEWELYKVEKYYISKPRFYALLLYLKNMHYTETQYVCMRTGSLQTEYWYTTCFSGIYGREVNIEFNTGSAFFVYKIADLRYLNNALLEHFYNGHLTRKETIVLPPDNSPVVPPTIGIFTDDDI